VARMAARVAANQTLYHLTTGRSLRYAPFQLADRLAPWALARGMAWAYGYDATQAK
jgi:hypothetical protein